MPPRIHCCRPEDGNHARSDQQDFRPTEDRLEQSLVRGRHWHAHRVLHSGLKLVAKDDVQVPTVVPPHAKVSETLVPVESIDASLGGVLNPLMLDLAEDIFSPAGIATLMGWHPELRQTV